jgi:hypothetical protein
MHWRRRWTRTILLLWTTAGLAVGSILPGCGSEGSQSSQGETSEAKAEVANPSKTKRAVRLPKTVNPNASNKGIKGKYAD